MANHRITNRYFQIEQGHLNTVFLNKLPTALQHPDDEKLPQPDMYRYVFCRVIQDIGDFQADDDSQTQKMHKGDVFLIRYEIIRNLLLTNKIELV